MSDYLLCFRCDPTQARGVGRCRCVHGPRGAKAL